MLLTQLFPGQDPTRDDIQQTSFGYDIMGRYICNSWAEVTPAQSGSGYSFNAIVIGAGAAVLGALTRGLR